MELLWYKFNFREKRFFDQFHSAFKTMLANIENDRGNTIYLSPNLWDFSVAYISLNADNISDFDFFLEEYSAEQCDKPVELKYFDGNPPL